MINFVLCYSSGFINQVRLRYTNGTIKTSYESIASVMSILKSPIQNKGLFCSCKVCIVSVNLIIN